MRCATFAARKDAQARADQVETQIDQLHPSGVTQAKGTLGDLTDRYTRESFSLKPWGRSKSTDLKRLKKEGATSNRVLDRQCSTIVSDDLSTMRQLPARGAVNGQHARADIIHSPSGHTRFNRARCAAWRPISSAGTQANVQRLG